MATCKLQGKYHIHVRSQEIAMSSPRRVSRPIATVDAAIFTIRDGRLDLLLHRRPDAPFSGAWALPGGYVRPEEDADAEAAIRRILKTKTGLSGFYLEQLATYSGRDRDPRGWSLSIAWLALVQREALDPAPDGEDVALWPADALPELAFDHSAIVADGLARLRGKGGYSTLPASFLGEEFTLTELHKAYEIVLGCPLEQSSFRRKVREIDLLEPTGRQSSKGSKRPAQLFRLRRGISTFDRSLGVTTS